MRRLALALAFATAAAAPLAAQESSPYGINLHAPGPAQRGPLLDRVAAAGIGWVRIDLVWAQVEVEPDRFDWTLYDGLIAAARARGLEVLAILAYTPAWATDGPPLAGVPRDPADWADFCRRVAHRYRDSLRHFEVWNEPNLDHFFAGSREQYLETILLPAADAIRAANPAARVGGPALAHLVSGDSDWYRWLDEILERAGDRLDFVSHHVYDDDHRGVTRKLEASTLFGDRPAFWGVVNPSLREVLEEAGWSGPVWLTETGWASDRVGQGSQADAYAGLLGAWLAGDPGRDWIAKLFFYELVDDPRAEIPDWGILDPGLREKPAYAVYRDFIAAHPVDEWGAPLLLAAGRFALVARWRDPASGRSGPAQPIPFSPETGGFWFFDPGNVELLAKLLDGRALNDRFWLFYGALSDVEYWIRATDLSTGEVSLYHNPPGTFCGQADTRAFPGGAASASAGAPAHPAPGGPASVAAAACLPGSTGALCLGEQRFAVSVEWRDHSDRRGAATPIAGSGDSGYFWFFAPGNLELAVKILDGRPVNGRFWVFYGALSDVEYQVTVEDTTTGARRTYHNPRGTFCGRADTQAF
jgi:hypothetical protein